MKDLLGFLFRFAPKLMIMAAIASVGTGLTNMALLALVSEGIASEEPKKLILSFLGLCLLLPSLRLLSAYLTVSISQGAIFGMRMDLAAKILQSPLRRLEELGGNKIYASLTTDIAVITQVLTNLPIVIMHLAIVAGGLTYLFYLNVSAGLGIVIVTLAGSALYVIVSRIGQKYFATARVQMDKLFKHMDALTRGTKELKLHATRRENFLGEHLESTANSLKDQLTRGMVIFAAGGSMGHIMFFLAVGFCVFWLPSINPEITPEIVTGYSLVILFLLNPLEVLTNFAPALMNGAVSYKKVHELGISLKRSDNHQGNTEQPEKQFESIQYKDITHTYHVEKEDRAFTMGPINLTFRPGELIFLVGGNGSGKTTLAKMLVGLYAPESGEILLDGEPVTTKNRDGFRQHFTGVFADFFLFEDLIGMEKIGLEQRVGDYLEKLQLNHKVKLENGELSTVDLSQGQRKRLALLTAYLEDRQIYMFDEWAADQDPLFKDVFYKRLLPELKEKGKTIIAITHDDHYFHMADRIIKLDFGQIEFDCPADQYHEAGVEEEE